jgi:hypothetical protein
MFFRLKDPFGMIREEVESVLRAQIPDTDVVSIATFEQPKFLTLGRKDGDGSLAVVTHFGFCVRAKLSVLFDEQRKGEVIESAITFLFANVDQPGAEKCRTFLDMHAEAEAKFDDEVFKQRFLAFRAAPS